MEEQRRQLQEMIMAVLEGENIETDNKFAVGMHTCKEKLDKSAEDNSKASRIAKTITTPVPSMQTQLGTKQPTWIPNHNHPSQSCQV